MRTFEIAIRTTLAAAALALATGGSAFADGDRRAPTVVELFTSQSCYSCPPAEAFLGELAARDDILALEFHVDYWDSLDYGPHGRWKDVYAEPAFTERQRTYNRGLRGSGSVYTPQMVVDGRYEAVGSRRHEVDRILADAEGPASGVSVSVDRPAGGGIAVSLDGARAGAADVWLATYLPERTTRVLRGENHGKSLTNHNVVRAFRRIGEWRGGTRTIAVPDFTLDEGLGCAVLVQEAGSGPVLGAAYCPGAAGRNS